MIRTREVYAVVHFKHGWLLDTCAGGAYGQREEDALTFATWGEAEQAMTAAGLGELGVDYEIVPLQQTAAT